MATPHIFHAGDLEVIQEDLLLNRVTQHRNGRLTASAEVNGTVKLPSGRHIYVSRFIDLPATYLEEV